MSRMDSPCASMSSSLAMLGCPPPTAMRWECGRVCHSHSHHPLPTLWGPRSTTLRTPRSHRDESLCSDLHILVQDVCCNCQSPHSVLIVWRHCTLPAPTQFLPTTTASVPRTPSNLLWLSTSTWQVVSSWFTLINRLAGSPYPSRQVTSVIHGH